MQKPTLKVFQANTKAKSADVNYNFEELSDYVFGSSDELKTFVQTQIANMNLALNNTVFTGKIEIYAGSAENIPTGYLLCDGQEVSRETYSNLFDVIGTTYGEGNGVNTFNVPDLVAKFIEGGSTAGTVKEAGLPNITGNFGKTQTISNDSFGNGAFTVVLDGSTGDANNGATNLYHWTFDASRSSSIYGKSNTVQPPALTMLYIIKT